MTTVYVTFGLCRLMVFLLTIENPPPAPAVGTGAARFCLMRGPPQICPAEQRKRRLPSGKRRGADSIWGRNRLEPALPVYCFGASRSMAAYTRRLMDSGPVFSATANSSHTRRSAIFKYRESTCPSFFLWAANSFSFK